MRTNFSEAPIFVCWETTKSCLLACRHCRARAIRKPLPGELDHQQGLNLIDELLEFDQPYPALLMTGGDPLMRADFFELIEHAKNRGLYVAVAASVTPLLNEDTIERMHLLDVDVMSVSVDGATAVTHDKLRGVPATFQRTVDALQLSRKLGLKAQINTTVMRSNIEELPDIFNLVRRTGAVAWEVFFLIRTGRGSSLESLEPFECEQVMHFLFDASQYGIPVRTAEGPQFRRVRIQRLNHEASPQGMLYRRLETNLHITEGSPTSSPVTKLTQTGDGKGIVFITHDGQVYPSGFLPISTGKLAENSLSSIYRLNPLFVSLRDPSNLKGRCGKCEYRMVCGGSRSRAFSEYGDPFQEDPACPYVPEQRPAVLQSFKTTTENR